MEIRSIGFCPKAKTSKIGKRASKDVKLTLIHNAFEKGRALLPNFRSNSYMLNLK